MIIAQSRPMLAPSEIKAANLQLATDAHDLSALTAGASVATWANNGAHSDDLIASGGGQPTYQPTGLNGRPCVQFDGTDDFMTIDALASLFSGSDMPFTFAAVMNATGATTQIVASLGSSSDANHFHYFGFSSAAAMQISRRGGAGDTQTTPIAPTVSSGPRIFVYVFNGTSVDAYYDGRKILSGTALDKLTLSVNRFTIGAFRRITVASFFNSKIGELAGWNAVLNEDEVNGLTNYWSQRWWG